MLCDVTGIVERTVINTLLNFLCTVTVIWLIYEFIKSRKRARDEIHTIHKTYNHMSFVFFGFVVIVFISWTFSSALFCINRQTQQFPRMSGRIFQILQYALLTYMLFYRLCLVFNDTPLAVSRCTIWLFRGLYIAVVTSGFLTLVTVMDTNVPVLLFALLAVSQLLLAPTLIVMLVGLFIRKMTLIQKQSVDQQIMVVVVKTFVLTIASIATLVAVIFAFGIQSYIGDSVHLRFCTSIVADVDTMTNFLAIMFGFSEFEEKYLVLCGSCHRSCMRCCTKIVDNDETKLGKEIRAERVGPASKDAA
eukprot:14943_1